MHAVNRPEVYITFADQKFDPNGRLTDEKARGLVKDLLTAFINWTRRLQPK
jgi:chromate reductase, NAD(P)H dehydrogenase (quinone)